MNNKSEAHIKKGEDKVQIPNALQALDLFQQGNSHIRSDSYVTELFDQKRAPNSGPIYKDTYGQYSMHESFRKESGIKR